MSNDRQQLRCVPRLYKARGAGTGTSGGVPPYSFGQIAAYSPASYAFLEARRGAAHGTVARGESVVAGGWLLAVACRRRGAAHDTVARGESVVAGGWLLVVDMAAGGSGGWCWCWLLAVDMAAVTRGVLVQLLRVVACLVLQRVPYHGQADVFNVFSGCVAYKQCGVKTEERDPTYQHVFVGSFTGPTPVCGESDSDAVLLPFDTV